MTAKFERQDRYTIELPVVSIDESKIISGMIPVTENSGQKFHDVVYRFARYIQRENGYDFAPYGPYGLEEVRYKAYLLLGNSRHGFQKEQPVGVVLFDWMTEQRCSESGYFNRWWLEWAWVHPYERGDKAWGGIGALEKAWPHFKEEFGDFWIQPPLSKAMKGFLEKQKSKEAA